MAESGDPPPVGGHGLGVLDGSADDFPPGPVVGDQLRDELEDLDGVVTVRKPIGRPLVGQDQSGELFGLPGGVYPNETSSADIKTMLHQVENCLFTTQCRRTLDHSWCLASLAA